MRRSLSIVAMALTGVTLFAAGCGRESTPQAQPTPAPAGGAATPSAGHNAPIALGSATAGPFTIDATRDQGKIEAGKDAPIDVRVKSTPPAKITAVRFWIGHQSGQGSVKAKADIENPAEPDRWHTHAEIPNPIPADAKLWVEIEPETGDKQVASFDLKAQ
jgi:hypothetical protein